MRKKGSDAQVRARDFESRYSAFASTLVASEAAVRVADASDAAALVTWLASAEDKCSHCP